MGLMDMFGKKSPLVDTGKSLKNAQGKLSGAPRMTADGDFSVWFVPENKQPLNNLKQVANPNGMLELKVKTVGQYKQSFLDAVAGMADQPVFVTGILVNDDSQGGKVQVHPLDLIYAPLPPERFPGWFKEIQKNLKDPNAVLVYRFAAATDASKASKPPKAEEVRELQAAFPYPNKPMLPKIKIDFEIRKTALMAAEFQLSNDMIRQKVVLDLTVDSSKNEGPGIFTGDLVIYWANE